MTPETTAAVEAEPVGADTGSDQRVRILDCALSLMGDQGAQNTSMRQLAAACDLNVATIYHYFPSKAAILQALIADKRYIERMEEEPAPVDDSLPPRDRLVALLRIMYEGALAEEATLKLIIGESLRNEQIALDAVSGISDALERNLRSWLRNHFAELDRDPEIVARLLRDQVLSFCVEALATPDGRRPERLDERTRDVAVLLFPD